jgi:hypothetical protein
VLEEKRIEDRADGLNDGNVDHGCDVLDTVLIVDFDVGFEVGLEASIEDGFSDIVNDRVLRHVGVFFHLLEDVDLRSFEPTVHEWHPADIGFVDVEHTGTRDGGGRGVS